MDYHFGKGGARVRELMQAAVDGDLEHSLDERALSFEYQPIVRSRDHVVVGYEALLRAEIGGITEAGDVVEAALHTGNMWRLGRLVRDIASRPLSDWAESLALFINMHPAELEDPVLCDREAVHSHWADRIIFELSERQAALEEAALRARIERVRAIGYRVAIDDVGVEGGRLELLAQIKPEFIKLDAGLVHKLAVSEPDQAFVRRAVELATTMGTCVVAEGIETARDADLVVRLGCQLSQGFYFGRPRLMPPEAIRS